MSDGRRLDQQFQLTVVSTLVVCNVEIKEKWERLHELGYGEKFEDMFFYRNPDFVTIGNQYTAAGQDLNRMCHWLCAGAESIEKFYSFCDSREIKRPSTEVINLILELKHLHKLKYKLENW